MRQDWRAIAAGIFVVTLASLTSTGFEQIASTDSGFMVMADCGCFSWCSPPCKPRPRPLIKNRNAAPLKQSKPNNN
jgi:hypothetical protein